MTITVSDAFDGGSIAVRSTSGTEVRLAVRADRDSEFLQWFFFRLDGVREGGCRVVIENASETTYPDGWKGYHVATSADRVHWYRTPSVYDDETLSWHVEPGHDTLWFAYFAPYTLERHDGLVARSDRRARCPPRAARRHRRGSLDRLPARRRRSPDDLVAEDAGSEGVARPEGAQRRAEEDRRQVWAIARQHPGESMAEWWMEGWLERLLDPDDATSRALRAIADIHVVPNMNPDGTFRGHLRTNAAGANLNREWAEPSLERSPEVFHVRRRMRETGVDLALDIHGDEALPYNFIAGTEGITGWNDAHDAELVGFKRTLAALNPDFQVEHGYPRNRPGAANLSFASNHAASTHGCLAMTLEMPFKDTADTPRPTVGWSPERSARLGRSFVDAVHLALTGRLLPGDR